VLTATGLCAGYGHVDAIVDVSLHVNEGEVLALLGANGAGKTTAVRAIAGLVALRRGTVTLCGDDITQLPTFVRARRGLGVVLDERLLSPALTSAENVRLGTAHADHRDEVAHWFPVLAGLASQRAGTLSGGEQRVVALARALVAKPRVLVVDELSAGLAPALAGRVIDALRRVAGEWGTAVVVVEQATELALRAADRAVVLARGVVALEGSASELARRPDVLATAYLGGH
jgi:branched-chain amino acid transport system ATP-binding protein